MGAPRVLVWDGIAEAPEQVAEMADHLALTIDRAVRESAVPDPPTVYVEPHPFTFALRYKQLPLLSAKLSEVGARICLDLCHFAVALGPDFIELLDDQTWTLADHIHFSDSDGISSELHFPPGDGILRLDQLAKRLASTAQTCTWDLFGWPAPRAAISRCLPDYERFLTGLRVSDC
jgi:sugar phosphate isomerase/epimerase